MNNIEEGLKRRIGSNYLIGCFTIKKDGRTCFTDIRGGEGDLVNIPSLGDDLEIEYTGKPLEVGVFYSFNWHLSDGLYYFLLFYFIYEVFCLKSYDFIIYSDSVGLIACMVTYYIVISYNDDKRINSYLSPTSHS